VKEKEKIEYLIGAVQQEIREISKIDSQILKGVVSLSDLILSKKRNIVFTGIGKSGLIANRVSSSLASISVSSFYYSMEELLHGSSGVLSEDDLLVVFSKSGNSHEFKVLAEIAKAKGVYLVGISFNGESILSKLSNSFINLNRVKEHEKLHLVPSISTTVMNVVGNLLITLIVKMKEYNEYEFKVNHPNGSIGHYLNDLVKDHMIKADNTAVCRLNDGMIKVISEMTKYSWGVVVIIENNNVVGLITDGDLRRGFNNYGKDFLDKNASEVLNSNYSFISSDMSIDSALKIMENDSKKISVLPVINDDYYIGIIRLHDVVSKI
jgi:arabinose-5-phosphate isomerase